MASIKRGRWPLTKDELAQLLFCHIDIAADLIENTNTKIQKYKNTKIQITNFFRERWRETSLPSFSSVTLALQQISLSSLTRSRWLPKDQNKTLVKDIRFELQDDKVNTNKILCMVVLIIWSGALMQFTITINSSGVAFLEIALMQFTITIIPSGVLGLYNWSTKIEVCAHC